MAFSRWPCQSPRHLMKRLPILFTLVALVCGDSAASGAPNPEFELIHTFESGPNQAAEGSLTDGGDGWVCGSGTGTGKGKFSLGTIFKVRPDGSEIKAAHILAPGEGSVPFASLWNDKAGFLWGTTRDGGSRPNSQGTIFKISTATG